MSSTRKTRLQLDVPIRSIRRKTESPSCAANSLQSKKNSESIEVFQWSPATVALLHQFYVSRGRNPSMISADFNKEGFEISSQKIRTKLSTPGIKKNLPQWYFLKFFLLFVIIQGA